MGVLDRLSAATARSAATRRRSWRSPRPRASSARSKTSSTQFANAVDANAQLREAITNRALPVENQHRARPRHARRPGDPVALNLLVSFLVEAGRARDMTKIAQAVVGVAAQERQHEVAEVRSAVPLSDAQRERLDDGAVARHGQAGRGEGRGGSDGGGRRRRPRRRRGLRRLGREPARGRQTGTRELMEAMATGSGPAEDRRRAPPQRRELHAVGRAVKRSAGSSRPVTASPASRGFPGRWRTSCSSSPAASSASR